MAQGIYHGRLVTDGYGNLLADEGPDQGEPVKYHDGSYIFLQPGELSHNETYHEQFKAVDGTRDASMTDDEDLINAGGEHGNMHHFEVQEEDPHYNGLRFGPDAQESKISGHTDAYKTSGDK